MPRLILDVLCFYPDASTISVSKLTSARQSYFYYCSDLIQILNLPATAKTQQQGLDLLQGRDQLLLAEGFCHHLSICLAFIQLKAVKEVLFAKIIFMLIIKFVIILNHYFMLVQKDFVIPFIVSAWSFH